jgi:Ca2+-transporting ATPase
MTGLTTKEAEKLLTQHGPNVITEQKKKNIFFKFIEQFNNFLTSLLSGAATSACVMVS